MTDYEGCLVMDLDDVREWKMFEPLQVQKLSILQCKYN